MTTTRIDTVRGADGPPPPPRAGRNRLVGAALIVLSLAATLTCYFVFTTWLPNDRTLYREYKAAEACPARRVIPRSEDCLRKVTFTVEGTRKTTKNMRATLLGPEPFPRMVVPFGDRGPVLSGLQQGDRVTGTVWRGVVVVVAEGDVRQNSADAPRDEPQMTAAVGTFAGLLAALALMFGAMLAVSQNKQVVRQAGLAGVNHLEHGPAGPAFWRFGREDRQNFWDATGNPRRDV